MFDEAEKEYLEVLKSDPLHVKGLYNLGNLYIQLGQGGKAIELFQRLLRLESMGYEEVDRFTARRYETGKDGIRLAEA